MAGSLSSLLWGRGGRRPGDGQPLSAAAHFVYWQRVAVVGDCLRPALAFAAAHDRGMPSRPGPRGDLYLQAPLTWVALRSRARNGAFLPHRSHNRPDDPRRGS